MTELPKAVLLDCNGTVLDMQVVMAQNIHMAWEEFGRILTTQDIMDAWGSPVDETYRKLFGDHMPWQELRKLFWKYDDQFPRRLLPGVSSALDICRDEGVMTGIVTSGLRLKVLGYLEQAGLKPDSVDFVHTIEDIGEDVAAYRPTLTKAMGICAVHDIARSDIVFVGDEAVTRTDAEAVGIGYVVVANGTKLKHTLLQQGVPKNRLIDTMEQLPEYLGFSQHA